MLSDTDMASKANKAKTQVVLSRDAIDEVKVYLFLGDYRNVIELFLRLDI